MKKLIRIILSFLLIFATTVAAFASYSSEELAVKKALSTAFDTIKSLDIEKIKSDYYDNASKEYIDAVEKFFNEYPEGKAMGVFILGEIEYDIVDVKKVEDKIIAKVVFKTPDIKRIVNKVMPKILFKNFFSLFSKKISNKNIMYIIECIYEEIVAEKSDINKYEKEDISFDFVFKKSNGYYIISNFDDLVSILKKIVTIK